MLRVDTGCIVGVSADGRLRHPYVGGIKRALFGGEGLFFATLRGPGPRLAAITAAQPSGGSHRRRRARRGRGGREEGSISAAGRMLDGDNS